MTTSVNQAGVWAMLVMAAFRSGIENIANAQLNLMYTYTGGTESCRFLCCTVVLIIMVIFIGSHIKTPYHAYSYFIGLKKNIMTYE